jgi:hypothetical protein
VVSQHHRENIPPASSILNGLLRDGVAGWAASQ